MGKSIGPGDFVYLLSWLAVIHNIYHYNVIIVRCEDFSVAFQVWLGYSSLATQAEYSTNQRMCFYFLVKTHSPFCHSLGCAKVCVAASGVVRFSVRQLRLAHLFTYGGRKNEYV